METAKILTADVLDIVFDGRNKSYGAYELRKHYQQRMIKALLITLSIFLIIGGSVWVKNVFAKSDKASEFIISPPVTITEIKEVKEELPPPPPPPPATKVESPKIKTIEFVNPIVTSEPIVDPPPTQSELMDTRISNVTQEGVKDVGIVTLPESLDDGKGLIAKPVKKEVDLPFTKVEIEASYIGDWRRFLERNLSGDVAVDNGAAPGIYTVVIEFIVDKQGNLSNIKSLTNKGFGMEEEAIRVIKKSGKWKPAFQNKGPVKAYRRQPITFQVIE